MAHRVLAITLLCIGIAIPSPAQVSQDARNEIQRTVIAQQATARIALPADAAGVELTDTGQVKQDKIAKQLRKAGTAIDQGKVTKVTAIDFGSKTIEVELDGGGKKKGFLSRIEVGVGSGNQTRPVSGGESEKAKGSKVVLKFAGIVPPGLTPDQLRNLLNPILDFNQSNFLKTGVDALPPEFREAVQAKEARIGMDRNTVLMALGRPNNRVRETVEGTEQEDWIYYGRGLRATFVTFEDNVVVRIQEHGAPAQ